MVYTLNSMVFEKNEEMTVCEVKIGNEKVELKK